MAFTKLSRIVYFSPLTSYFLLPTSYFSRLTSYLLLLTSYFLSLLLSSCATLPPPPAAGFEMSYIKTSNFTLATYYKFKEPGAPLTIYIEGDGYAWKSKSQLSDDPTPSNSLMLALAGMDTSPNVAYLARPGQYPANGRPDCGPEYWSNKRFAPEVISSMSEAIDQLKLRAKSDKIDLIGYSGGAAVAVLITAERKDIASIRTIAGNLNPEALNKYHRVSPLTGSLDPMNVAERIKAVSQRHFVGSKDKIVPPFIAESFVERMGDKDKARITIIDGATHDKGWKEMWREVGSKK